jgi:hypothetical protein
MAQPRGSAQSPSELATQFFLCSSFYEHPHVHGLLNTVPLAAFTSTLRPNDTLSFDLIGKLNRFSSIRQPRLAAE